MFYCSYHTYSINLFFFNFGSLVHLACESNELATTEIGKSLYEKCFYQFVSVVFMKNGGCLLRFLI
jgi:hypothetical protein